MKGTADRRRARSAAADAADGADGGDGGAPKHAIVDWASVIARWYRELAMDYPPDRGGSTEVMQALNDVHKRLKELVGV